MREHRHIGRGREHGFSFIEILIVMGIIAVLVGMVVVAIQIWGRKGPEFLTKQRLQKVAAGARQVHSTFEVYPPLDIKDVPKLTGVVPKGKIKPPRNSTNEGIETLVQMLYWQGLKYDPQITDDEFINTDEDELGAPVNKRNNPELLEIRDEWQNPLIYIPARSYGEADAEGVRYMTFDGIDVSARPWKSEYGGFEQPDSFQLFSMGPDGEPNTEDDIRHWRD
ncbi:MAG: prepilin-type N-terminal cleavage/methylation domain-containing protein [Planctomycetota bacterium]|nr:prepilin-type N-terminal cleavage/methylation domain-containing protein [Planctomycetota bacterium]